MGNRSVELSDIGCHKPNSQTGLMVSKKVNDIPCVLHIGWHHTYQRLQKKSIYLPTWEVTEFIPLKMGCPGGQVRLLCTFGR